MSFSGCPFQGVRGCAEAVRSKAVQGCPRLCEAVRFKARVSEAVRGCAKLCVPRLCKAVRGFAEGRSRRLTQVKQTTTTPRHHTHRTTPPHHPRETRATQLPQANFRESNHNDQHAERAKTKWPRAATTSLTPALRPSLGSLRLSHAAANPNIQRKATAARRGCLANTCLKHPATPPLTDSLAGPLAEPSQKTSRNPSQNPRRTRHRTLTDSLAAPTI